MENTKTKHIIYFDGVCNLCHWSVKLVLKRDREKKFRFAPFQSEFASSNLQKINSTNPETNSVIYQRGNSYYFKSKAVLQILHEMGGAWRVFGVVSVLPTSFLDKLYDFIANHRHRWFGKQDSCIVPSTDIKARFLS